MAWYLIKCLEGNEKNYERIYQKLTAMENLQEIVCFEYQRMFRYCGKWHMEKRVVLPGWIYLSGPESIDLRRFNKRLGGQMELDRNIVVIPCEEPYLRPLCQEGSLICMSRGIIEDGNPKIISGPLKGREFLIRRIDRHKRIAAIEIPFAGQNIQVVVGLEIYEK